jgi:hypothetical protein
MRGSSVRVVLAVVGLIAVVALGLTFLNRDSAAPEVAEREPPLPTIPPDPNDALFIPAPPGTQMAANDTIDDPERLALYVGDEEAAAYSAHGFRRLLQRSYYGGAQGGGFIKLIEVDDPVGLLDDLDALEAGGLGQPYADLPQGRQRDSQSQMENGQHIVTAYFRTITFVTDPYVVQVEAYGITPEAVLAAPSSTPTTNTHSSGRAASRRRDTRTGSAGDRRGHCLRYRRRRGGIPDSAVTGRPAAHGLSGASY